jgi:hypothetical protein
MGEVKKQFIRALEGAADALQDAVGKQELSGEIREDNAQLNHPDFQAKWSLATTPDRLRNRAAKLRRGDRQLGDWPPFQPTDASEMVKMVDWVLEEARRTSGNEILSRHIERAFSPVLDVVRRHAIETPEGWMFKAEDCDPIPEWNPPPAQD